MLAHSDVSAETSPRQTSREPVYIHETFVLYCVHRSQIGVTSSGKIVRVLYRPCRDAAWFSGSMYSWSKHHQCYFPCSAFDQQQQPWESRQLHLEQAGKQHRQSPAQNTTGSAQCQGGLTSRFRRECITAVHLAVLYQIHEQTLCVHHVGLWQRHQGDHTNTSKKASKMPRTP